ncbi:hypothetical protein [Frankia sp. ArI3]|uniref:hypothetical protein n=1 Tax=Frankia sp. ArI3 TaxID=1858 RepID=UPI0021062F49|nr:hypothetical protein [Frankia sp. ArI3]
MSTSSSARDQVMPAWLPLSSNQACRRSSTSRPPAFSSASIALMSDWDGTPSRPRSALDK